MDVTGIEENEDTASIGLPIPSARINPESFAYVLSCKENYRELSDDESEESDDEEDDEAPDGLKDTSVFKCPQPPPEVQAEISRYYRQLWTNFFLNKEPRRRKYKEKKLKLFGYTRTEAIMSGMWWTLFGVSMYFHYRAARYLYQKYLCK
ncbi:Oidioi.mRNA.OKI2018_I69.PAR.g11462.t1.cds [Oikopleura dioica]|uniref:Oidioi.mRNA.OKI2018_I69.PAR.g11462.t1.cds n=1 Tax=Oikopleura dioica TaxID=34765 RepID=A0ABN7RVU1_OIKDI|nr:Oidioi.mRNA.OKI2018_I69.PAR.g11462.t1.cds [Oikopleura dioica]